MCDNKYIQMVLQQSPPSIPEILSSFLSEAPHVLSNQLPAPLSYPLGSHHPSFSLYECDYN